MRKKIVEVEREKELTREDKKQISRGARESARACGAIKIVIRDNSEKEENNGRTSIDGTKPQTQALQKGVNKVQCREIKRDSVKRQVVEGLQ